MKKKQLKQQVAKLENELRWSEYRENRYRQQIAKLTGVEFVFGIDTTDMTADGPTWHQPIARQPYVSVETENEQALRLGFDKFNALLAGQFVDEVK